MFTRWRRLIDSRVARRRGDASASAPGCIITASLLLCHHGRSLCSLRWRPPAGGGVDAAWDDAQEVRGRGALAGDAKPLASPGCGLERPARSVPAGVAAAVADRGPAVATRAFGASEDGRAVRSHRWSHRRWIDGARTRCGGGWDELREQRSERGPSDVERRATRTRRAQARATATRDAPTEAQRGPAPIGAVAWSKLARFDAEGSRCGSCTRHAHGGPQSGVRGRIDLWMLVRRLAPRVLLASPRRCRLSVMTAIQRRALMTSPSDIEDGWS